MCRAHHSYIVFGWLERYDHKTDALGALPDCCVWLAVVTDTGSIAVVGTGDVSIFVDPIEDGSDPKPSTVWAGSGIAPFVEPAVELAALWLALAPL